jgi:hypothetical protein
VRHGCDTTEFNYTIVVVDTSVFSVFRDVIRMRLVEAAQRYHQQHHSSIGAKKLGDNFS